MLQQQSMPIRKVNSKTIIDFLHNFYNPQANRFGAGSICEEPQDYGTCEDNVLTYYYNTHTASCEGFYYSGCGGNGNRFTSLEQCERQCGEYRGVGKLLGRGGGTWYNADLIISLPQDVCHQPLETGPCDQWQTRYHYDVHTRRCTPFTYGGCEGNGNRFASQHECESLCIVHEEPDKQDNKGKQPFWQALVLFLSFQK
jgi:papilin